MSSKAAAAATTKIPSALRNLYKYGHDALKPHPIIDYTSKRQRWKRPLISKRVAKTLRKKAVREGTFGSYDPLTGIGWDAKWDVDTTNSSSGVGAGVDVDVDATAAIKKNIPWMELRPMKGKKRERTREERALKIEGLLEDADEKILNYRLAQKDKKPEPGIENLIKRMFKDGTY
mmetsp:Transcript_6626/g.8391  ORF Transcript_6626/g.8391 Transcript_6626/m.8391 type:complete len:175 (-) Transcript_6626:10-534(-)